MTDRPIHRTARIAAMLQQWPHVQAALQRMTQTALADRLGIKRHTLRRDLELIQSGRIQAETTRYENILKDAATGPVTRERAAKGVPRENEA